MKTAHITQFALGLAASAGAVLALGGCTYSTWPPIEEGRRQESASNINHEPTPLVISEALSFVTLRYPPVEGAERGLVYERPFAVSLPAGADGESYDYVVRRVQRGAQAATEENASLYTYFVTRVISRVTWAEVDVLRPVPELGPDAQGRPRYQGITVHLRGTFSNWRIEGHRTFPVGMMDVPERTVRPTTAPTWGAGTPE